MAKWEVMLMKTKMLYEGHMMFKNVHKTTNNVGSKALCIWMGRFITVIKVQASIYFTCFMGLMLTPIGFLYFKNEQVLFITIELPYLDSGTNEGFTILLIYEMVLVFITILGVFTLDCLFVFKCFNAASYVELVRLDCVNIKNVINASTAYNNKLDHIKIRTLLRDSIVNSQNMKMYNNNYLFK